MGFLQILVIPLWVWARFLQVFRPIAQLASRLPYPPDKKCPCHSRKPLIFQALNVLSPVFTVLLKPFRWFAASSAALQRVQYLELVLALLERYGNREGALQCARAAIQELDAAYPHPSSTDQLSQEPDSTMELSGSELALSTSQAREVHESLLWGHVFDLTLQLGRYDEAYAATVSNPDAGSGGENLRRLVTVLCEAGAVEVLCGQQLPYAGNLAAVHHELLRRVSSPKRSSPHFASVCGDVVHNV